MSIFGVNVEPLPPTKIVYNHAFMNLKLDARAAIVYDLTNGRTIYNLNKNEKLPIASITKVMTILTSNDLISPETVIDVGAIATNTDSYDGGLIEGERWSLKNLANLTLAMSSNYGATLIAQKTEAITGENFITAMNQKAKSLGLNDSYFRNETGLDLAYNVAGSYSTAEDIAKLFTFTIKNRPNLLSATRYKNTYTETLDGTRHYILNTNEVADKIPDLIASKTGYTYLAGGNLAVVFNIHPNHPMAVVILGSSQQGRFTDTIKLVQATVGYFADNGL